MQQQATSISASINIITLSLNIKSWVCSKQKEIAVTKQAIHIKANETYQNRTRSSFHEALVWYHDANEARI